MARLDRMPKQERDHLLCLPCPTYDTTPWVDGPPLFMQRVAMVTTAGLHRRRDRPYGPGEVDYRIIPRETGASDLVMSHISSNFDRTGFQQDWNVVFPLDRLRELADSGTIDSLADFHYAFMGATDPRQLEGTVRDLAAIMKNDGVNAVLLVPV